MGGVESMSDQPELPGMPEAPEPPEWVKSWRWIWHHVQQEGAVIRRAPGAVLLTAVVIALAFWLYDKSRFDDRIANLEAANGTLQATIQLQNTRISMLQPNQTNQPTAAVNGAAQNKYVCTAYVAARKPGMYGILVEFGVKEKASNGLVAYIGLSGKYATVEHWEGEPLRTDVPTNPGGMYGDFGENKAEQSYTLRFRTPQITPVQSEFVYFESDQKLTILQIFYLDDIFILNSPLKANQEAAQFGDCPRK
jgi:hypothetical protein